MSKEEFNRDNTISIATWIFKLAILNLRELHRIVSATGTNTAQVTSPNSTFDYDYVDNQMLREAAQLAYLGLANDHELAVMPNHATGCDEDDSIVLMNPTGSIQVIINASRPRKTRKVQYVDLTVTSTVHEKQSMALITLSIT